MTGEPRRARLRALAKLNLGLRVLCKRPDGYHELRTIFQTISLADVIEVEYRPARRTRIELQSEVDIPDNLIVRAAEMVMDVSGARGEVRFKLNKKIPMGGGLGGGSTDAAAVLLALPVLAGKRLDLETLLDLARQLGSDVPYFLLGGTAVGLGRGTELYPLPDLPGCAGLLVASGVHVSTAEAYAALKRGLTTELQQNMIDSFQSSAWLMRQGLPAESRLKLAGNDFESVVFGRHPQLDSIKRRLLQRGARTAMMTGSGSGVFGLFASREAVLRAQKLFKEERAFPISLVTRSRYQALWWRQLAEHGEPNIWPPQSRYAR
jgi:4-diphosphocytidyl-2-C-methyl-D-erythritol kinase